MYISMEDRKECLCTCAVCIITRSFGEKCIVVFCLDFKFSTELSSVVDPDLDKRNWIQS